MTAGYDSGDKTALEAVAYVSFQELATRVSHRNTGKVTGDPIAEQLLARIAKDENLHMIFYRNIVQAALEIAPDETMRAITDEVVGFQMPGADDRRLPAQLGADRQGRHLRPAPPPRRRDHAGAAALEGLRPHRLRPRGRAGPRGAGRSSSPASTPRPPGSSSSATGCASGRRPAPPSELIGSAAAIRSRSPTSFEHRPGADLRTTTARAYRVRATTNRTSEDIASRAEDSGSSSSSL